MNNFKVISIKEPWASLIKEKIKIIETRSWATKYRGYLYIHASKKAITKKEIINTQEQINLLNNNNFKYGYIIAKCRLVDCKYIDEKFIKNIQNNHNEYICGIYEIGRYAWILEDIEVLNECVFAKGQLGIWNYKK